MKKDLRNALGTIGAIVIVAIGARVAWISQEKSLTTNYLYASPYTDGNGQRNLTTKSRVSHAS